jgi:hypothetical protein
MGHFKGYFEGAKTLLTPKLSRSQRGTISGSNVYIAELAGRGALCRSMSPNFNVPNINVLHINGSLLQP